MIELLSSSKTFRSLIDFFIRCHLFLVIDVQLDPTIARNRFVYNGVKKTLLQKESTFV